MKFGRVLEEMQKDNTKKFARVGWNGKRQYIMLQLPDKNSKMTLPYIYIKTVQDELVPWLASQTDMLADDWVFYNEKLRDLTLDEKAPVDLSWHVNVSCPKTIEEMERFQWTPIDHNAQVMVQKKETGWHKKEFDKMMDEQREAIMRAALGPRKGPDLVNHPDHYTQGRKYEPWDVAIDWGIVDDGLLFSAFRYISSAGRKPYPGKTLEESRIIDVEKAIEYLKKDLEYLLSKEYGNDNKE